MNKVAKIIAGIFAVLALGIGNLRAAIIEINITAEITEVADPDGLLSGQLGVGSIITGSYTYDSSTLDSALGPSIGRYLHYSPPYGISLSGGGFVFQTDPDNVDFLVEIGNNSVATTDNYLIRSWNNLPLYDNVEVGEVWWQLDDSTGTALSSDALPTTPPVLEDWDFDWGIKIQGGIPYESAFYIEAPVTSVELVPEPATLLLLGFGTLMLRKRKQEI
jgi:hypothetical protein